MSSLTSRIRPADNKATSSEDIFASAADLLFPDSLRNLHGDPGSSIIYSAPYFGEIELRLADPAQRDERFLFAHYLWNASALLADFVERAGYESSRDSQLWSVAGEKVLELGAGTGLAGIVAAMAGADEVVLADYPSPVIINTLIANVSSNLNNALRGRVFVQGHEWGEVSDSFSLDKCGRFTRILCADCLWMDGEHRNLVKSMLNFLSYEESARVWVIAGFHTGRAKVAAFFGVALKAALCIERIWERDAEGLERKWDPDQGGGLEDVDERKKWLVVAILKRRHLPPGTVLFDRDYIETQA